MCQLFIPSAFSANRYNADKWQYIKDVDINGYGWRDPNLEQGVDANFGRNCKYFVRYVCYSEDRGYLPSNNGDRELSGLTVREGGQWLNDEHNNTGPSAEELRDVIFAHAHPGDVVQMYWFETMHTALINDIDENGVVFFQSHENNQNVITSTRYSWNDLSDYYSRNKTKGGLSIYSFNNPFKIPPDGNYTAIRGVYNNKVTMQDSPMNLIEGYMNIQGIKEGKDTEWLILDGEAQFEGASFWLHGKNTLAFNRKEIKKNSDNIFREWEANHPEHLYYGSGYGNDPLVYRARETIYRISQNQNSEDLFVFTIEHNYSAIEVTFRRNRNTSSSSSSVRSSNAKVSRQGIGSSFEGRNEDND